MKTFYYTIKKIGYSWDELPQESIEFDTWGQFARFCNNLSKEKKTEIRGCEQVGYFSNGSYFMKY